MRRSIAVLAALAVLAGCGKEPTPSSAPPPVAPASSSQPSAAATPTPAPPRADGTSTTVPQPANPGAPSGTGGNAGGTVVAEPTGAVGMPNVGEIVTAPVSAMIEQKRKLALMEARNVLTTCEALTGERPKSLEEAAKACNVKCPLPPDGWRWRYDARTGEIDMVKE